jgi:hypothetical protein
VRVLLRRASYDALCTVNFGRDGCGGGKDAGARSMARIGEIDAKMPSVRSPTAAWSLVTSEGEVRFAT